MSRKNIIRVRYSDEEYKSLVSLASESGLPVTQYIRQRSLSQHTRPINPEINIKTYAALMKIAELLEEVQRASIPGINAQMLEELQAVVRQTRREIALPKQNEYLESVC